MPELPEVETIIRELKPLLTGRTIKMVEPLWAKTFVDQAERPVSGQTIRQIRRIGKYILFDLDQSHLVIHLRMTGRLSIQNNQFELNDHPHLRCLIYFEDGSVLLFEDTRKFGRIYHVEQAEQVLKEVGLDAFDPQMTFDYFYSSLKKRKMGIKAFLMSQKWIAGLGNIYTDESLFRAKIHPEQLCSKISRKKAKELYDAVQYILQKAVENMGSTISDYRDAYGNPGQNQLYFKVYKRAGQPCFNCGTLIEKKRVAGRGTHFCPKCQKIRGKE